MKVVTMISSIITFLLLLSTMICGLWLKANNATDPSSFSFHMNCGIASVVFCFITIVLLAVTLQ
ncbi:hypothetical protein Desor_3850 [Desulfosporosinus orientis DSM 765]|uniref:Uncharacterized protein n=1 Tax=Desulfosporosinus orientis (strain ATCC 19365 / DSM 765 / NCIMB 8382 / VKM B-1628 / Singapore I) TaxID=768706 RepID=G7W9G7_DESOD|nr:hypothetical protein [Desulfosporosinus orientis]AET69304.1 hypothetical protein Desor_3850 [Desulfosporosinus orientis DSM 765]